MAPESRIDELTARYAEHPRRYFAPLANEYRKAGDPERAIALCRVHLPTQPGHMSGHIVLGQALFDAGELAAARTAFATAVALDDENLVALRHLGDIARLEGDHAEARSWYARVLDADPQQPEVEGLMAALAAEAAEREAAAQDAATVAADAESRPLPGPTETPFPGGIGFSEEELDAFIAHVPVVDEAAEHGSPSGHATGAAEGEPVEGGATTAPVAAVGDDVPGEMPVVGEDVPTVTVETEQHVHEAAAAEAAPLGAGDADGRRTVEAAAWASDVEQEAAPDESVTADAHAPVDAQGATDVETTPDVRAMPGQAPDDAEPLVPVDDPAWASATPIESPWLVSAEERRDDVVEGEAEAEPAPATALSATLPPMMGTDAQASGESDAAEADEAWLPIVEIASLAPDDATSEGEASSAPDEPTPEVVVPGGTAVSDELVPASVAAAGTPASREEGDASAAVASSEEIEVRPAGAEESRYDVAFAPAGAADSGGVAVVDGSGAADTSGGSEFGTAAGGGSGDVPEVVTARAEESVDDVAHVVAASAATERGVDEVPAAAAAPASTIVGATGAGAAVETPSVARAATPVRAAALRLLSSLAPWRQGDSVAESAATVAAEGDAPDASATTDAPVAARVEVAGGDAGSESAAADTWMRRAGDDEDRASERDGEAEAGLTDHGDEAAADAADGSSPIETSAAEPVTQAAAASGTAMSAADASTADEAVADEAVAHGAPADVLGANDEPVDVAEPAAAMTVRRPTPASFTTATMAELYRRQGFLAEALAVYKELSEREPGDAWYRAQVVALAQELAQRTPAVAHEAISDKSQHDNELADDDSRGITPASTLTPPGFASIAPALAEAAPLAPTATGEAGDWFGDAPEPTPDDWFGDVVPAESEAAVDELFGMESDVAPTRPAMPTPISLDALGGGLDELFGMPVIAATDASAAAWLEALGGELVGRAVGAPEGLPIPEAFDLPRGGVSASAPGPLLSFDRFFGPTPPSVRRQEEPGRAPLPPVTIGPSFGGTPLMAPRPAEPGGWTAAPPSAPPASPQSAADGGPKPPASDFHKWLEGLT